MKTIDIVCPVFREEESIALFHEALAAAIGSYGPEYQFRIRYVLDPWPDRTEDLLRSISATDDRVEVVVMSRRFGHQAALVAGMDLSSADAIIMLDSDLQHPPSLVPELIRAWESGADIVQAVRRDPRNTGAFKRLTSRWFYQAFLKLSGTNLQIGAADYRLVSSRIAELFRDDIKEHNPFLRGLVGWVGFRIEYVPFVPAARVHGRSKYRVSTLINFALNGICSFSKLPLRWCVTVGLILSFVSVLLGIAQVLVYSLGVLQVPGWASLFSAISFIGGIQLFFLGVLGEYIGMIFDEVKGRPRYIVDKHNKVAKTHDQRSGQAEFELPRSQ